MLSSKSQKVMIIITMVLCIICGCGTSSFQFHQAHLLTKTNKLYTTMGGGCVTYLVGEKTMTLAESPVL